MCACAYLYIYGCFFQYKNVCYPHSLQALLKTGKGESWVLAVRYKIRQTTPPPPPPPPHPPRGAGGARRGALGAGAEEGGLMLKLRAENFEFQYMGG
jgi:hypothetical protein